tara:strand:+ start:470 stop:769 length:300 start_codon:yes stop_codon:yes gene_type:complete
MIKFLNIRKIVRQIPRGKVTTYGAIAKKLKTHDNRLVGWAIYRNTDASIPCHRVLKKDGSVAEKFSLGGPKTQKRKLVAEGINFINQKQVNLQKHFWQP